MANSKKNNQTDEILQKILTKFKEHAKDFYPILRKAAEGDEEAAKEVIQIIKNSKEFKAFPTFHQQHNAEIAAQKITEMVKKERQALANQSPRDNTNLSQNDALAQEITDDYVTTHPLDSGDIHAITIKLEEYSNESSQILVDAIQDTKNIPRLVEVLKTSEAFKSYPTHNNTAVAEQAASEIASYGFINDLLKFQPEDPSDKITDVSFNGRFMVIATNNRRFRYGRRKGHEDEPIITEETIRSIVNKFANREGANGVNFGPGNPSLDAFSNNLRLNAIDKSLSPSGMTMSLRVSRASLALNRANFKNFAPNEIYLLLKQLVKGGANIMISGATGTGKTELLKLLVDEIPEDDKVIMIEDVQETHLQQIYPRKNIYDWVTTAKFTIKDHVKNSLRNQPDWILVSETRGSEAYEMYQSFLTGHPIMTTLHATSNEAVPDRLYGMCSMSDFKIPENLKEDLFTYLDIGVHITRKVINGKVYRFADSVCEFGNPDEVYPGTDKKVYPKGIHELYTSQLLTHYNDDGIMVDKHGKPTDKPDQNINIFPPTENLVNKIYTATGDNIYSFYNFMGGTQYDVRHLFDFAQDAAYLEKMREAEESKKQKAAIGDVVVDGVYNKIKNNNFRLDESSSNIDKYGHTLDEAKHENSFIDTDD